MHHASRRATAHVRRAAPRARACARGRESARSAVQSPRSTRSPRRGSTRRCSENSDRIPGMMRSAAERSHSLHLCTANHIRPHRGDVDQCIRTLTTRALDADRRPTTFATGSQLGRCETIEVEARLVVAHGERMRSIISRSRRCGQPRRCGHPRSSTGRDAGVFTGEVISGSTMRTSRSPRDRLVAHDGSGRSCRHGTRPDDVAHEATRVL